MQITAYIATAHRIFGAAILCFFAFVPLYITGGIVWNIVKDPKGTPLSAVVALAICLPLAYFLLMLAWRAFTGRSPRKDGGLLPPLVLQIFAVLFGAIAAAGIAANFSSNRYLAALGGLGFLGAAVTVFQIAKRRQGRVEQ